MTSRPLSAFLPPPPPPPPQSPPPPPHILWFQWEDFVPTWRTHSRRQAHTLDFAHVDLPALAAGEVVTADRSPRVPEWFYGFGGGPKEEEDEEEAEEEEAAAAAAAEPRKVSDVYATARATVW
ncbi:unnamed protein product [Schistocephalus solidus]|uniref:Uncharacterized protein n=1 Tax=Schistocephalus solidus TaxID=70667 RepID=A0A183TA67_SCHSO|nr:unnamed protein product [Schistocephalus solidus]